ncbi:transglycosylase SLT domain-containing protein [bacterium]|nr:transglycosylase SLT domain-containing protein [bacterium]
MPTTKAMELYEKVLEDVDHKKHKELTHLKDAIPTSYIKDASYLKMGREHINNKKPDLAYAVLRKIKKKSPLYPYASLFKAKAFYLKKYYKKALGKLVKVTNPTKKIDWDIYWYRMGLLALTSQKDDLLKELAPIQKKHHKDKWVKIKGSYYQGILAHVNNKTEEAYTHFRNVVVTHAGSEYDDNIFDYLKIKAITPNSLLNTALWNKRAENLANNGFPSKALEIWEALYERNPSYEEKVAYGHFKARDYKNAAKLYTTLIQNKTHTSSTADVLDNIAHAHLRSDNFRDAEHYFAKILKDYPESRAARVARFKMGFLYFDSMQYQKSIYYFEKYLSKGTHWQRDRANWFQMWSYYLMGDYEKALQENKRLAILYRRNTNRKIALMYWEARLNELLNIHTKAYTLYETLKKADPLSYYGLLAAQRLKYKKLHPKTLINPSLLSFIPQDNKANTLSFKGLKNISHTDSLVTGILLYKIGFVNYAFDETRYSEVIKIIPDYQTAKYIESAGNYNRGYGLRKVATTTLLTGGTQAQGYNLAFPKAYEDFAKNFSEIWSVDEKLIYSVMRQESAFKPEALSYAFAYGLMQVIPPTGKEIANTIHFSDFHASKLNKPEVNIFFGSYYLRYLLELFDDELVFAIAGYNAGPDAVKRWSGKAYKIEMDEFIELIPYMETHDYVKKVLVNYLVYNHLYK